MLVFDKSTNTYNSITFAIRSYFGE